MTLRLRLTVSAVLFVTLAAAACAGIGAPVEKPRAEVRAASLEEVGPTGISGRVAFDVTNPNAFGVPLRTMTYVMHIGGVDGPTMTVSLDQMIPARGSAPVDARIALGYREAATLAGVVAQGARAYRITGHLVFATRFGDLEVAFAADGTI